MKKEMVLGFIFTPDFEKILLIRKNKPEFQKGLLNGIGGKLEEHETPYDAMIRETKEETALEISHYHWKYQGNMHGKDWEVAMYSSVIHEEQIPMAESLTDEPVGWYNTQDIIYGSEYKTLKNLPFLIQMCICRYRDKSLQPVILDYL